MQFIDLFAGLGGFHVALNKLGHECVYASEKNLELNKLYSENFKIDVAGDITKIDIKNIPKHDILCAGFPCQPFSKAGRQKGMNEDRGKLIDSVISILEYHKPKYFILENVRNLETHNNGNTWKYIQTKLEHLNYSVDKQIISPHHIGIPQHRERIFIVGSKNGLSHFKWIEKLDINIDVKSIITNNIIDDSLKIEENKIKTLDVWQKFLDALPNGVKPYTPLWSLEFGATYPYENIDYSKISEEELWEYKGKFGHALNNLSKDEIYKFLPNYIKKQKGDIPKWKQCFIRNNREFYNKYKKNIDPILPLIIDLQVESWQKFEWNCLDLEKNIWNYLIQFRGSGIRIKRTDYFPSLVTVGTQMPIIGWEKRYISPIEGMRTQSLPESIKLPSTLASTFKALGNSVNTEIVYAIAKNLIV